MLQTQIRPRHAAAWAGILMAHAAVIAALLMGTGVMKIPADVPQPSIEVMLLPPPQLPRVKSLAPPPRYLNLEQLNPRMPPLLTNPSAEQPTLPGSSANGYGAGVDWLAEARRAVRANDIRNEYSVYVSDKAAARDWWPEVRRAGAQYKTAGGDWIVWVNSSCYFVAGANPRTAERMTTTAKVVCLRQDVAVPPSLEPSDAALGDRVAGR